MARTYIWYDIENKVMTDCKPKGECQRIYLDKTYVWLGNKWHYQRLTPRLKKLVHPEEMTVTATWKPNKETL